jgi:hypothetical protein
MIEERAERSAMPSYFHRSFVFRVWRGCGPFTIPTDFPMPAVALRSWQKSTFGAVLCPATSTVHLQAALA